MKHSRQDLIMCMADLFGYSLAGDFDGFTAEDIWNELDEDDQAEVTDYLAE